MQTQTTNHTETAQSEPAVDIGHELQKGFAARLIRKKAKQLIGRAGYLKADQRDLEQELRLRVWLAFAQFDPARAHWNAYVTTVVERHVATLLEHGRRSKRMQDPNTVSLSELVEDSDQELVELAEMIGPQHQEALTGRYVDSAENQSDLKLDVAQIMAGLPDDLRVLCELLKEHSITEAAEKLGIPRTSASYQLLRLRTIFSEAGFGEFFEERSSDFDETR